MEPLFLGNHPALDFLNTTYNLHAETIDVIRDGPLFLDWLVQAGLIERSTASTFKDQKALDAVAAEARKLRAWATEWIARWRGAPDGDYTTERRRLNTLLKRARSHREVIERWELVERWDFESADQLLALLALELARFVTAEQPDLVKRCSGADCTVWFVDRTKGHRRVFCSPTACGNRAKVAAFRERQRTEG